MSNKMFKAVSTGLGVGLLAATLSAPASAAPVSQSWAAGMIFYKGGTTPTYVVNVPSGNSSTDYTLVIELASTVANLNAFSIGYEFGALSTGSGETNKLSLLSATNDTNSALVTWVNSQGSSVNFSLANSVSSNGGAGLFQLWGGASTSWLTKGANSYTQSLSGNLLFGTGTAALACPYSMTAKLDVNGNFSIDSHTNSIYAPMSALVSQYSSITSAAQASYFFPIVTKTSGLVAGDWTSYGTAKFSAWDAQTDGSIAVPSSLFKVAYTTSQATLGSSSSAASLPAWPTSAATLVAKINTCNGVYANRVALNNSGLIIGGTNGLSRIW